MFSFIWPGVATPSAKNEVHNRSALLVLALATLMDDLLPKSNQAGLPNKSFLAFVWQITDITDMTDLTDRVYSLLSFF